MEIENKIQSAQQASKSYPELVKAYVQIGIRSYTVDVATGIILYRFDEGYTFIHNNDISARQITEQFNKELTFQAVKDTQQGKTKYPEFMDAIAKSGVRFYEATLSGDKKRVTYIGKGGSYEELIPI